MLIAIFDTETTGLPVRNRPLADQPYIIQFAAITYEFHEQTGMFREVEKYDQLIKPPIPVPPDSTRISGITNESVANAPTFAQVADKILDIFDKADLAVAHNLSFDREMLENEFERLGKGKNFLPANHYDSMEGTRHICKLPTKTGGYKSPKLMELHQFLLNESFEDAHNAIKDVEALGRCMKVILREGIYRPPQKVQRVQEQEQISLF
jgi:DNA polymerase III subunit alpha